MAESLKNGEKLSMTSSDLGSSCCENDADLSNDVKDKSDDAISVAESTSLTIDSLEEEEIKEQSIDVPAATTKKSKILKYSNSKESFYLHEQKENSDSDGCKNQSQVSGSILNSECGTSDDRSPEFNSSGNEIEDSNLRSVDKGKANCLNKSENGCEAKEQTTMEREQTDTKSVTSSETGGDTRTNLEETSQKTNGFPLDTNSSTSSAKSEEPHVLSEDHEEKLILRKSRSLTDESSTDPSPKHSRRSGIPRRKNSTQSMITVLSSSRSTPQTSPARIRRSLTLDSAGESDLPAASKWTATSQSRASLRSFPTSPTKVQSKLRRSASQCECFSVGAVSCPPLALSRDNVSSRLRFEKNHQDHGQVDPPGMYLTPSQRKDVTIKELKAQVKELSKQLEDKDKELEDLGKLVIEEKLRVRQTLQEELEEAQSAAEAARREVASLQESHTDSVKKVATLQQQLDDLKKDMRSKLAESEQIFLEMYNKGRQSAIFEHEEEMEIKRKGGRSQEATDKEIYNKLVRTQAELAKWQTIQRHESYHTMPIPGTEAETTLRFLKDSVFHFLTTDKSASDEHLRAIVRILHFSEVQREKIAQAIIMKRNKSGW